MGTLQALPQEQGILLSHSSDVLTTGDLSHAVGAGGVVLTQQLSSSDICSEMTTFPQRPAWHFWLTYRAASVSLLGG